MGRIPDTAARGTETEHSWCHGKRALALMTNARCRVMNHVTQELHEEIKAVYLRRKQITERSVETIS
jgi:hypothetical protein